MVRLVTAVGHQQHVMAKVRQQPAQFHLQLVPQVAVQRRKRLIQQQQFGFVHQNPRQRRTLLLPAGQLVRTAVFQPFQLEQRQHAAHLLFPAGLVRFPAQAAQDVLPHRHVGEQCVILKQIAHLPLLGRQVNFFVGIKQRHAVQHDAALVRRFHTGDAFQGQAFAAAGGPQQAQHGGGVVLGLKADVQRERAVGFADVHQQTHRRTAFLPAFWRSSSRLTMSSTTAEMARLTSTQRKAPASSLVRQSWYTVVEMVAVLPGV